MDKICSDCQKKRDNLRAKIKFLDKTTVVSLASMCAAGVVGIIGFCFLNDQSHYKKEADQLLDKYGYSAYYQTISEDKTLDESKSAYMKSKATDDDYNAYAEYRNYEEKSKSAGTGAICGAGVVGVASMIVGAKAIEKKQKNQKELTSLTCVYE